MNNYTFTINSRKADNRIHRSWQARLIEETREYWLFKGEFSETVRHKLLGTIECGTISYEYYWRDRWYNIFRFHEPDGEFRNFYCNLNLPPTLSQNILDYIDLDIDVLVRKDLSFEILDIEEFEVNARLFGYSVQTRDKVQASLNELLGLIQHQQFPFNHGF